MVGLAGSGMSPTCRDNWNCSLSKTANSQGLFITFTCVQMLENRMDLRECVSARVGSCSTGEVSSVGRTTGGAGVACCTFVRRVIIFRVLVCEPFRSSFSM